MSAVDAVPRLCRGVKRGYDEVRGSHVVLFPEGVLVLNETAAAVVELCDGRNSVCDIAARLADEFDGVRVEDVLELVGRLARRKVVEVRG